MKKQLLSMLVLGFLLGSFTSPLPAERKLTEVFLGDETFPSLRIWNFVDRMVNARLFVSTTAEPGKDALCFRIRSRQTEFRAPAQHCANTRTEGEAHAAGGFLCAETEGAGIAFGGNANATTYSGAPAVGLGVNGGNAPTEWALGVETPGAAPKGKPKVGIMLPGPAQGFRHNPASQTGMVIGTIDSGEAIRIQENHRIALNNVGSIYLKYNAETNQIEFYNSLALKHANLMD